MAQRNEYLIKRVFFKYLLPGILMTAAMQLGNLVDSIFVGNILGSEALSAINIAMPIVMLSQTLLMILSTGGSMTAGILLGKREKEKASDVFSVATVVLVSFNTILAIASLFFVDPLCAAMAGEGNLAQQAAIFAKVNLLGLPIMVFSIQLASFLGIDNHPTEGAALHIIANVINLVTDLLYLQVFKMGIFGSAFSTVTGYSLAGIFMAIRYAHSKKRMLQFSLTRGLKKVSLLKEITAPGLSAGLMIALTSVKMFILNGAILDKTGEDGMAIYAVFTNSLFLVQLCLQGFSGVISSVGGVLYGEKDYYGLRQVLRRVMVFSASIAVLLTAFFLLWPQLIAGLFGFDLPELADTMDLCLRIYSLSFLFYGINIIIQTYYSTTEKAAMATVNTLLQGFIILIPVTLLLLGPAGVLGTSIASVAAEAGACAVIFIWRILGQKKGIIEGKDFAAVPSLAEGQFVDLTIRGTQTEAASIAHQLVNYCEDQKIDRRTANAVAFAGEELVYNICRYGGEKPDYIDVGLTRVGDSLILRIRDDGAAFDPLDYLQKLGPKQQGDMPRGIQMIRSLAEKMDYARLLNMNNTVVEIKIR